MSLFTKSPPKKTAKTERVNITGTVKNSEGMPLEDVAILFNGKQVAKTDKEGRFEFEMEIKELSETYVLLVKHEGMSALRNYHAAMRSTSFDTVRNWRK